MTFAQFVGSGSTGIIGIMNVVIAPVILALAFLAFVWGVLKYFVFHGGEDKQREEGRQFVLWGLLGMVLLFAVWGVVNLLLSTLGIAPRP
jgi:hypothetical protein